MIWLLVGLLALLAAFCSLVLTRVWRLHEEVKRLARGDRERRLGERRRTSRPVSVERRRHERRGGARGREDADPGPDEPSRTRILRDPGHAGTGPDEDRPQPSGSDAQEAQIGVGPRARVSL